MLGGLVDAQPMPSGNVPEPEGQGLRISFRRKALAPADVAIALRQRREIGIDHRKEMVPNGRIESQRSRVGKPCTGLRCCLEERVQGLSAVVNSRHYRSDDQTGIETDTCQLPKRTESYVRHP